MNRAVAVDVRGMIEALRKVYGAEALVGELAGSGRSDGATVDATVTSFQLHSSKGLSAHFQQVL